ncbi:MAG TPA: NYN domain-containing protein [Bryobacteraceae bacterium]|nr:NYN domain-containing protein [Bryobacteraceae bacterium]
MQDRPNIAVFVDYDNIEIGVKSTLRREFDVSVALSALKERGDIVAKFAYANWGRQEGATRQMAENAVQMVQRIPSPRGDKNGADINLALDALEMAFTHAHVNAFAIVSGDSDFIPLVNKLKEYGKTVFVLGGKAFTSTILQQNCHEFVSYESLLEDGDRIVATPMPDRRDRDRFERADRPDRKDKREGEKRERGPRPAPLDLSQAFPLVERALQVLERRAVQPQLGLLKSTMLQLDPAFSERAYGAGSFSDFVDRLKKADFINVTGSGGRYVIERRGGHVPEKAAPRPEEALPLLRDVLETHRMELENGASADELEQWVSEENPDFSLAKYGFQQFSEFLNYAQDKTVVRTDPDEERGLIVHLGAEFYPPALPERGPEPIPEEEEYEPQPIVEGQPTIFEPNPPPPKPKKTVTRKRAATGTRTPRPRKRKPEQQ